MTTEYAPLTAAQREILLAYGWTENSLPTTAAAGTIAVTATYKTRETLLRVQGLIA